MEHELRPALRRCTDIDPQVFAERYWGRRPLLTRAEDTGSSFTDLLDLPAVDELLSRRGLRTPFLRIAKDGAVVDAKRFTTSGGAGAEIADQVSSDAVLRLFADGSTVVLQGLHRLWPPLIEFADQLAADLGHPTQVNAYITPPRSRGFDVHRDDHDVFVLQISGSKHWIVYDRADDQRVLLDTDLQSGSTLYIPRGFPHAASAGEGASAHLTVGIVTHEAIEVVREVAKLAEDEPAFRERLPVDAAAEPEVLRATASRWLDEIRAWLDKVDVDEVTERLARRVMSTSQPILRGQLRQLELLDAIHADTELARRRGAVCVLFGKETSLKVLLGDRELEMPLAVERAMQEVARRETLRVRDLHPFLDPPSALMLVRRLVREGLLEVVVDG